MIDQIAVRPCVGMFGSLARSSRTYTALAMRTSSALAGLPELVLRGQRAAADVPGDGGVVGELGERLDDPLQALGARVGGDGHGRGPEAPAAVERGVHGRSVSPPSL